MKYGMNLLLWTDHLHDGLLPILEQLKALGYDGVEVPIFDPRPELFIPWKKKLTDLGLACTAVAVRGAADNPISPDAKVRALGVQNNKLTVDCCAAIGAETLLGPFHSAIGEFTGKGPTEDEFKWGVESMRQVAEHAGQANVRLACEYLNRFELYFLNCAAQMVRFVKAVDHPACGMMYDTFHANIEEKDISTAIRLAAPHLYHVHISENDRSTPGQGEIGWNETFNALHEVKYNGWLVVEAFGLALPGISAATKIWRRMFDDEMQLAKEGLAFMKKEVGKRG
ncbi:MAG: sugar phosphate isomerase/epimerase [Pirellulales bacterium]|nr:sugar phosphate isomerase/epimerase [Pirellulales bacterium]